MVRASCILQLALGNVGVSGGGANIFRGHDNVQGATDVGPNPDSLPGYYGLAEGSFKHFAATWGVDFEWIKKQYAPGMMTKSGMTVSRWIDGVLEKNELIDQDSNLRGLFFWGHAPNSQTRGLEMKKAMDKLDLLVVVDPFPSATAAMAAMPGQAEDLNPNRAVYLLPACTQFETSGSVHGVEPLDPVAREGHRAAVGEPQRPHDHVPAGGEARLRQGAGQELQDAARSRASDEPVPEDILREINKCVWTIGYTGQSPERLKAHMRNMHVFDVKTLRAKGGIDKETGYELDGDYFGLPWPCFGTPELKHPGSPNLYDTCRHVMDGGGNFRANFGVERDGVNLLAGDGSHSKGADLTTGYPEFDHLLLKKLGWWDDLTEAEKKAAEGKNWKTDLSGGIIRVVIKNHGCHPFGNAKARAVVWNFPDPIPQHREPLYSNRPDLVAKYPTHDDKKAFWRLPTLFKTVQEKNKDIGKNFPLIMTSGRLVEYEGGGEETRSNPWLAELQQEMFVEINPKAANDRGIRNGEFVWVKTPPMAACPTSRACASRPW